MLIVAGHNQAAAQQPFNLCEYSQLNGQAISQAFQPICSEYS